MLTCFLFIRLLCVLLQGLKWLHKGSRVCRVLYLGSYGELKARMLSRPKSGNVFLREREDVLVLQQQKGVSNNGSVNCVCHILFIV